MHPHCALCLTSRNQSAVVLPASAAPQRHSIPQSQLALVHRLPLSQSHAPQRMYLGGPDAGLHEHLYNAMLLQTAFATTCRFVAANCFPSAGRIYDEGYVSSKVSLTSKSCLLTFSQALKEGCRVPRQGAGITSFARAPCPASLGNVTPSVMRPLVFVSHARMLAHGSCGANCGWFDKPGLTSTIATMPSERTWPSADASKDLLWPCNCLLG